MQEDILLKDIKESFIYGYPVVGMYELLYSQVIDEKTKTSGFNQFSHTAQVASPKTSFIPAPNNDTSYSRAWLDLRNGPVFITVPDTKDRYYSIQFLNLFSETLANVGRRTTGTKKQTYVVCGPKCHQTFDESMTVIKSDTTFVLAFLRVLLNGEEDVEIVKEIQNAIEIKGEAGDTFSLLKYENGDKKQFFLTLDKVLQITPVIKGEDEIRKKIAKSLAMPKALLEEGAKQALEEIVQGGNSFGEECNFWRIARKGIGNYGKDYFQRSVVWHKGALANQPEESLYPSTFQDSKGELLDGSNDYLLTFKEGQLPPVSEFWSLTMYIFDTAFLYDNEINRYSIGDRTQGLELNKDGSLTIYIQHESPRAPKAKANWLPAPKEKFFIALRLYGPSKDVINGAWQPPAIEKQDD